VATFGARAWAQFENIFGGTNDGFVVLYDEDGIASSAEFSKEVEEATCIARMEADTGFIEDEESAGETGAEAVGKVDALEFATWESAGGSVEREVAEAHTDQVAEAVTNIGERGLDGGIFRFYFLEEIREFGERERIEFGHGFACEVPEAGFGAVAMARTVGTDAVSAVAGEKHADVHFVGFGFEPAEEAADSVPVTRIPEFGQGAGAASLAFDDKGLLLGGEFVERNFERDFAAAAGFFEGLLTLFVGVGLPRFDHASCDGELAVGEGEGLIDFDNPTEAAASGAGAEGMVERE
jgi:hypothetical protein